MPAKPYPFARMAMLLFIACLFIGGGYWLYIEQATFHKAEPHQHAQEDGHAEEEAGHDGEDHGHEEVERALPSSRITPAVAEELGITLATAGEAAIYETVNVSGRVTLNRNHTAQVNARFPGPIRSVLREPGEAVKAGDTLATVESNDSLQIYAVKAPISGTIIARNANIGELAGNAPLFTISDLGQLWAELFVFSKDGEKISAGQKIRIQCLDDPVHTESIISLVLPTAESSSQTVVVRAVIDNHDNHWRSGMNIRADIVLAEHAVPLAVKTSALQRIDDQDVVFVVEDGDVYRALPVETGIHDTEWTEIRDGMQPGMRYVATNSFIVKADIEKSSAEHAH
jgi:cobalt-zinc-cadmium efflux system membrane fusion protein